MRMFHPGSPFMDVPTDHDPDLPVFSEGFLYEAVGKGEARFILAVVDEYDALIKLLGPELVNELLAVSRDDTDRQGEVLRDAVHDAVRAVR